MIDAIFLSDLYFISVIPSDPYRAMGLRRRVAVSVREVGHAHC